MDSVTQFDLGVLTWIKNTLRGDGNSFFDVFFKIITHFAEPAVCPIYPLVFIFIGTAIYLKRKSNNTLDERWRPKFDFAKMGWMMGVALLLGLVVCNFTLKPLIARPRPYTWEGYEALRMIELQSEKSFPSGHSVAVFEMALAVAYSTRKHGKIWGVIAYLYAILIAFSRLYVGVHYPTDIIGGAIVGTVCGILAVVIVKAIYKKFVDPKIYKPISEKGDK